MGEGSWRIILGDWADEEDQQKDAAAHGVHVVPANSETVDPVWVLLHLDAHVHEDRVAPEEVDDERVHKETDVVSPRKVPEGPRDTL